MTPGETAALVSAVAAAFPAARMSRDTVDIYREMLQDLDAQAASAAVRNLVRTAKWLPTIAEIRAAVVLVEDGPGGIALEQWGKVGRACERVGIYEPAPPFKDPITARCVESMDWRYLCKSPNEASDRARFCELYGQLRARYQTERQTGQLPAALPVKLLEGVGE